MQFYYQTFDGNRAGLAGLYVSPALEISLHARYMGMWTNSNH